MARARNIKPGFFKNADLVETSFETRLLFVGLWTLADREGRLQDRPKQIKMELFPADSVDVDACLNDLVDYGFIRRYVADGKKIIQVVNFGRHQTPHGKEADSELPDENGVYTVHERNKSGLVTDSSGAKTVQAQCKHSSEPVQEQCKHTLNPDSPFLNPDSPFLSVGEKPKQQRGSRLPADWSPSSADAMFCKTERPDLDVSKTADRFRDYWHAQPGAKGSKLDWSATWRNWVRNESKQQSFGGLSAKDAERKRTADQMFRRGEYAEPKREIDISGTAVVVDGQTIRAIRNDVWSDVD